MTWLFLENNNPTIGYPSQLSVRGGIDHLSKRGELKHVAAKFLY